MAVQRKEIYYRQKGSMGQNEYWWYLVLDKENRKFYIEYEWDCVPLGGGKASKGSSTLTIPEFLQQGHHGTEHTNFLNMIEVLFEEGNM
ncbi:hypothetical protein RYZ26_17150 [Terasakiella sp. A23]|uniref:hypothetical protein n=1 Tax=Terasakiella sp. FCG-A23 TaxID=3080561 RepID=UPI0029543F47|nr:hypothetical protein [Terasakiella sp. A23]MDV7341339.1 hypothetical protein [Terasakiella sp. A23]